MTSMKNNSDGGSYSDGEDDDDNNSSNCKTTVNKTTFALFEFYAVPMARSTRTAGLHIRESGENLPHRGELLA